GLGAGVAGEREHPVEVKYVTRAPPPRQVAVLERADADRLGDLLAQGRVVVPVGDHLPGALDRLVDQRDQLDRLTGAGPDPSPLAAADQADDRVSGADAVGQPARLAGP